MLTTRLRQGATRSILTGALLVTAGACSAGGGATAAPPSAAQPSAAQPSAAQPSAAQPSTASSAPTGMMASGRFHDVDGTATGKAQIVVKPDGTYEVVLEEFKIPAIEHTNIVLVANADVTTTADVDKTKLLDLGPLKAPEGMQDFPIPADMAGGVMEGYHTVVLWDTAMSHAIAAAPLK